jgi:hypothetical protein
MGGVKLKRNTADQLIGVTVTVATTPKLMLHGPLALARVWRVRGLGITVTGN